MQNPDSATRPVPAESNPSGGMTLGTYLNDVPVPLETWDMEAAGKQRTAVLFCTGEWRYADSAATFLIHSPRTDEDDGAPMTDPRDMTSEELKTAMKERRERELVRLMDEGMTLDQAAANRLGLTKDVRTWRRVQSGVLRTAE